MPAAASTMNATVATDQSEIFDAMRGTRDALTVRRVFGDPYTVDGVTIIPVARVSGGGGGGGGEGTGPDNQKGHGFGSGFGLGARPLGVYQVSGGRLDWKPAIDVDRIVRSTEVLAGIAMVCRTLVRLRRGR